MKLSETMLLIYINKIRNVGSSYAYALSHYFTCQAETVHMCFSMPKGVNSAWKSIGNESVDFL